MSDHIFIQGEHFRGRQYFDGTPGITQCPILPGSRLVLIIGYRM